MSIELKTKFESWYPKNKDNLLRLWGLLVSNLESILKEEGIKYFNIKYRIKELESIKTKIWKKWNYKEISDIDDICWLRITCFYEDDVEKIAELLCSKIKWLKKEVKDVSEVDRFWYRGTHLTWKIEKIWEKIPTFKWLSEYWFEIQIRTVVTHAWAEVEHQLSYKWDTAIPESIKRELSGISQKLEEIDRQFVSIREALELHKKKISRAISAWKKSPILIWLDVDNFCLEKYLSKIFGGNYKINTEYNWVIIRLCKENKIDMNSFIDLIWWNLEEINALFIDYEKSILWAKILKWVNWFMEAFSVQESARKSLVSISQFISDVMLVLYEGKIIKDNTWKWKRTFCERIKKMKNIP